MAEDTETITQKGFAVASDIRQGVPPHLFKTLLFAQAYKREWYEKNLAEILEKRQNPGWDLNDPEFVDALEELASRFEQEFAGQFPPETIENTIPQDIVDNLVETYESERPKAQQIREESERIAKEYVAELRRRGITLPENTEQQVTRRIATGVEGAIAGESTPQAFAKQASRVLEGELALSESRKQITTEQYQAVKEKASEAVTPMFSISWYKTRHQEAVKSGVLKTALSAQEGIENTHRPDLAAAIYQQLAREDGELTTPQRQNELMSQAANLARAAEPLMVAIDPTKSSDIAGEFIASLAKPGRESVVSALVSMMTPQQKERVAAELLKDGFEKLMANNDLLAKKLGGAFVSSPLFTMISESAKRSVIGGVPSAPTRTGAIFSDVAGSVFRGPLRSNLVYDADQPVINFFRLMAMNEQLPERFKYFYRAVSGEFLVPGPGPIVPHPAMPVSTPAQAVELQYLFTPQQFAVRTFLIHIQETRPAVFASMAENAWFYFVAKGTKGAAGKAAAGAAVKTAITTGAGGATIKFLGSKLSGTALGALIGSIIPGAGTLTGGVVGGIIQFIGGSVIGKAFSWLSNKIKTGGFIPNLDKVSNAIKEFFGQPVAKAKEWHKDPLFIGPLVLVAVVGLLPMYFTSFIGTKFRGAGLISTAVEEYTETIGESGARPRPGGAGPSFTWGGDQNLLPTSGITRCPVDGGVITQRPYDPNGSHANLNAFDFGGLAQGSPVYAAHDGFIVSTRTTFPANHYEYGSYGNYVLMVGRNSSGAVFFTIYAHLLPDIPSTIIAAAGTNTVITAGTLIGYLDTTGYTYGLGGVGHGTHLHFGYQGPGILTLPPGCP